MFVNKTAATGSLVDASVYSVLTQKRWCMMVTGVGDA